MTGKYPAGYNAGGGGGWYRSPSGDGGDGGGDGEPLKVITNPELSSNGNKYRIPESAGIAGYTRPDAVFELLNAYNAYTQSTK